MTPLVAQLSTWDDRRLERLLRLRPSWSARGPSALARLGGATPHARRPLRELPLPPDDGAAAAAVQRLRAGG